VPLTRPAVFSTRVCVIWPVLAQHTDCPTVIVTEDGVNAYSLTSTATAAPLLAHRSVAVGEEPVESPPQAAAVRATKVKSARLVRMDKNVSVGGPWFAAGSTRGTG